MSRDSRFARLEKKLARDKQFWIERSGFFFYVGALIFKVWRRKRISLFDNYFMMSKFKCKCLNVTIHVKEKVMREASGEAFVSDACVSAFFAGELYEVELAVGGITKVTQNLYYSG